MRPVTLRINSRIVDLLPDVSFGIDFSVFKVEELTDRSGGFSTTISIPATANNRQIFGNPQEITSISANPYRILPCRLYVDGVDVNVDSCEILTASDTEIEIRLYTAVSGIYFGMNNDNIEDIDLRDLDHYVTGVNIYDRLNVDQGIVYPLLNSMQQLNTALLNNTDKEIRSRTMLPCIYGDIMIERIFGKYGYQVTNNIDFGGNLVAFAPHGEWRRNKSPLRYLGVYTNPTDVMTFQSPTAFPLWFNTYAPESDSVNEQEFFRKSVANPALQGDFEYYVWDNLKQLKMNMGFYFTNPSTFAVGFEVRWFYSGAPNIIRVDNYTAPAGQTIFIDQTLDFLNVKEGTTIYMWIRLPFGQFSGGSYITNPQLIVYDVEIDKGGLVDVSKATTSPTINARYCTANSIIDQDQTVGEFLIEYLKLFSGVIQFDNLRKRVEIIEYNRILQNINNAVIWTNKVDHSEDPIVSLKPDAFAKRNNFTYKEPIKKSGKTSTGEQLADPEIPPYVNSFIQVDAENLRDKADVIKSEFAFAYTSILMDGITMANVPLYTEINNNTYYRNTLNQIVLFIRSATDPIDFINTDTAVTSSVNDYRIAWFFDESQPYSLGWAANLLDKYYNYLQRSIKTFKKVTMRVQLNPVDIRNLNFQKPVYISGTYYYINAVNGYDPVSGGSTDVELIKLSPYGRE